MVMKIKELPTPGALSYELRGLSSRVFYLDDVQIYIEDTKDSWHSAAYFPPDMDAESAKWFLAGFKSGALFVKNLQLKKRDIKIKEN